MPLLNADMNGHDGQDEASPDDTNWSTFPLPDATEPIAIIGLSTKFPQDATTTGNLWHLLLKGRSAWGEFPADRINPSGHYHPDPEHGGTVSNPLFSFLYSRESERERRRMRMLMLGSSLPSRGAISLPKILRISMRRSLARRGVKCSPWILSSGWF